MLLDDGFDATPLRVLEQHAGCLELRLDIVHGDRSRLVKITVNPSALMFAI